MDAKALLVKIVAAKRKIADAEGDLEKVLREIEIAPRADKTMISNVVAEAYKKVRAARQELVDSEELVENDV